MTLILSWSNAPFVQFVLQVIVSLVLVVVVNDFLPSRETARTQKGRRRERGIEGEEGCLARVRHWQVRRSKYSDRVEAGGCFDVALLHYLPSISCSRTLKGPH